MILKQILRMVFQRRTPACQGGLKAQRSRWSDLDIRAGQAGNFLLQRDPLAYDRQVATRAVELARYKLEDAERAYAASRQQLGELNKTRAKNRHDRDILPDHQVARMVSQCFGLMNKRRGAILQAKRALHTAQVALAQLAH